LNFLLQLARKKFEKRQRLAAENLASPSKSVKGEVGKGNEVSKVRSLPMHSCLGFGDFQHRIYGKVCSNVHNTPTRSIGCCGTGSRLVNRAGVGTEEGGHVISCHV
jgi:hypothetical protein